MDVLLAQEAGAAPSKLAAFLPFIVMFAVFYFLLIRPQQQQQKRRQALLDSLKKGDRVITVGGIHGEITDLKGDVITLRIADKVEIRLARAGVSIVKGRDSN